MRGDKGFKYGEPNITMALKVSVIIPLTELKCKISIFFSRTTYFSFSLEQSFVFFTLKYGENFLFQSATMCFTDFANK